MKGVMTYEKAQKALPDQEDSDRDIPFNGEKYRQEKIENSKHNKGHNIGNQNLNPKRRKPPGTCPYCNKTSHWG